MGLKLIILMIESVMFKDKYINPDKSRDMDISNESTLSWKNRLVGKGQSNLKKTTEGIDPECDDDFEFCEGDIKKSTINGIPLIEFSERVHQFFIQDMSITIVLKLLGRNIGYVALFNRIHSLWRPSVSIQLMDIENGYFLTKFSDKGDFDKMLWSFELGFYTWVGCMVQSKKQNSSTKTPTIVANMANGKDAYEPWIVVERRSWRISSKQRYNEENSGRIIGGSKFSMLISFDKDKEIIADGGEKSKGARSKEKEIVANSGLGV
ncbi:hypothetical protein GOBAR_DD04099 [Gossypium barbadense]|nr:hypothetical protein GOBAR_DD04099 [Gossypium barbadense]